MGVIGDGLVDVEGESEGGAAVLSRDPRCGAGADGGEEGLDLEAEGFALFDGGLVEVQATQPTQASIGLEWGTRE